MTPEEGQIFEDSFIGNEYRHYFIKYNGCEGDVCINYTKGHIAYFKSTKNCRLYDTKTGLTFITPEQELVAEKLFKYIEEEFLP